MHRYTKGVKTMTIKQVNTGAHGRKHRYFIENEGGGTVDSSAAVIDQLRQAGLSLADCIVWKTETTGMDQTRKFQELLEWDMEDDAKQAVIGTIIGTELETDAGNPSQYAKMLDALKQGLSVDQYLQMRIDGTDMDDYLELVDGGMDSDAAYEFSGYMDEAKVDGNAERWRACVDYFDDVEDQLTALSAVMTDAQFRKVEIANDFGVNPDTYVTLQEIKARYDADGSGTYNQKEIRAAIEGLPGYYTMEQKAVLWQLATGSTSAKNNPYSREVGQQVLTAKASDEEQTEGENSTLEDEVLKQLLGLG